MRRLRRVSGFGITLSVYESDCRFMRVGTDKGLTRIGTDFTDKDGLRTEALVGVGLLVLIGEIFGYQHRVNRGRVLFGGGLVCRRLRLTDDA